MINKKRSFFWSCVVVGYLFLFPSNLLAKDDDFVDKSDKKVTHRMDYAPGEVIVKYKTDKINFKDNDGLSKAAEVRSKFSLEKKEEIKDLNIEVLKTKGSVEETVDALEKDANVEYAEPNYLRYPAEINTDDTNRGLLWGLDNTGQTVNGVSGTADKDIDAPAAWNLSEGNGIIVAVIDTGVAYNHPDLVNNMWDGSSCKDYQGNSLGNCNHGYDFEDGDKTPLPTTSTHGTHVAGIIAAEKNNTKGVIGVAPKAKIMALKTNFSVAENVKAIDFAIQNGAKVINASYTGSNYSSTEYDAINRFKSAGGIFVAAAGNYSNNNDTTAYYPASYDLDNIISVAATDQNDNLASFSNYGQTSVDVAAPGVNIYSTVASATNIMKQDFESVTTPNIPSGWTKNGNWGTYNIGGSWGKVLYGDLTYPYANNANYTIESPSYDLSSIEASMSFWTACDTPDAPSSWKDYMALEYSADGGSNYTLISRWDKSYLGGSAQYLTFSIPSAFATSNFKFRFRWVTDSSDNNHDGCKIDDITFDKFTDGSDEKYGYMDGTSMATPYVVGEVALVMGADNTLTNVQVASLVENNADYISSLSTKLKFSKRINSYRAVSKTYLNNHSSSFGVYRFYRPDVNVHFYSSSLSEISSILDNDVNRSWRFEGFAYKAENTLSSDTIPLYRFYRTDVGVHFYTASESEKESIINSGASTWNYEGVAYYVLSSVYTGGYTNVYRFYRTDVGVHFYTASESEKESIINSGASTWNYEGVAFRIPM